MKGKLEQIAQVFVREVGDDLQRYTFVFPNHRAGLFFRKYLAKYVDSPLFAPRVMSINECFAQLTDLQVADPLTLLLRLYSEYCQIYPNAEGLDRFIYWGKMMLADFSEIDNHMVTHVEALFASIKDLHAIEERFHYLTDNQRKALSRFWQEFQVSNQRHPDTVLHQRFLHTWDLLYPLYTALRKNLKADGMAYEGMLHREVLEHWNEIPAEQFQEQYVFLGFNALTTSERELMLRLQREGKADFYFDYDSPYLRDPQNKASLFMNENQRLFQSRFTIPDSQYSVSSNDNSDITLITVPSTVGEVYEVHRILKGIIPTKAQDLTRTAVVLPDEQLLIPMLNAFPDSVEKINVTMGYPLRATSLYMSVAYSEQYLHSMPDRAEEFVAQMREYLLSLRNEDNAEGVYQLTKVLDRLKNAISNYKQIAFTVADVQQLLKMLTLESTIPYSGEPLDGLQVMGVLETRALDFDNVIITGFNDDEYPGRSSGNSFVPHTLRCGFDLPTLDRQNAIFAYNFYRMISYAKHVWLISNSVADEQHSGEVSRFYYQLKWQYGVDVKHVVVTHALRTPHVAVCLPIAKDQRLQAIRSLSATALTTYLRCPKQFYYKYIEHLKEPAPDESISVSELTLGNVLHGLMEKLYAPYVGKHVTASDVQELLDVVNDDSRWAIMDALASLRGDVLAERVVRSYVVNVLTYDYQQAPFTYVGSEQELYAYLQDCKLYGYADRIDIKGDTLRIIDYKTGRTDILYTSMKDVFGVTEKMTNEKYVPREKGKPQVLQTMLYCWCASNMQEYEWMTKNMVPHIYPVRRLQDVDMQTSVHTNTEEPLLFDKVQNREFVTELEQLLGELFDMNIPFVPTMDNHSCESCAFAQLCKS